MALPAEFLELLAGRDSNWHLDAAALEIAALDHQPVDRAGCLSQLDDWADEIRQGLPPDSGGAIFLSRLNEYFFQRLGFSGDLEDYHNSANSCLDQVLARRRGLPITLSVVYMELARRLTRTMEGVALPAHFLCRFVENDLPVYIDVFHNGRLMTEEDCVELISRALGQPVDLDPATYPAASSRVILHRMINNLRNAYERTGRFQAAMDLEKLQRTTIHGEPD